jgi:hypothetical protein
LNWISDDLLDGDARAFASIEWAIMEFFCITLLATKLKRL